MAVRAKDIAEKLGVSITTVSLVLNNKPGIGEKTRKRVLEEINDSGYLDKFIQKQNNRIKNIRFILFKGHGLVVDDTPFFSRMIESIVCYARENEFSVIISYVNKDTNLFKYIKQLKEDESIAGILLLATEMKEGDAKKFDQIKIPLLILDNYFPTLNIDSVSIDNAEGVQSAINYFIECGHKEIGYIHSSADIYNFEQRYIGFRASLIYNGLEFNEQYVIELEPTVEGSHRDMKQYMEKGIELPKAFFADNDILAMGASKALKEAGYKLPQDVSIVGFDDMPYCVMLRPQLTTIKVNNSDMGAVAVRRLIDLINKKTEDSIRILIRTKLITRNSVKEM